MSVCLKLEELLAAQAQQFRGYIFEPSFQELSHESERLAVGWAALSGSAPGSAEVHRGSGGGAEHREQSVPGSAASTYPLGMLASGASLPPASTAGSSIGGVGGLVHAAVSVRSRFSAFSGSPGPWPTPAGEVRTSLCFSQLTMLLLAGNEDLSYTFPQFTSYCVKSSQKDNL